MILVGEVLLAAAVGGTAAAWEAIKLLTILLSPARRDELRRKYQQREHA
jgi:hypothetical protein